MNARRLAEGLSQIPGISIDLDNVATNIVIFDISETGKPSAEIAGALHHARHPRHRIWQQIRMVTHLDVSAMTSRQQLMPCVGF